MSKELAFYVNFHVKEEFLEKWQMAAREVIDQMSEEDTFILCYMHQDAQDPNKFTLYERWAEPSMEAFIENQLNAKEYRKKYEEILPEMLETPRTFSVLNTLQEWRRK